MSTLVRTTGILPTGSPAPDAVSGRRHTFKLSNGNTLILVHDRNTVGAPGGDNTGVSKIYVYEKDGTSHVVTLRATIAEPTGGSSMITGAVFANNDLGILARTADSKNLRYTKMTYSGYSVAAWETAMASATYGANAVFGFIDMDITDGNLPVIAYQFYDTGTFSLSYAIANRLSGAATWTQLGPGQHYTGGQRNTGLEAISIVALGLVGTTRSLAVVVGAGRIGKDYGYTQNGFTFNETTGAWIGGAAFGTYQADWMPTGTLSAGSRNIVCFRTGTDEYLTALGQTGTSFLVQTQVCSYAGAGLAGYPIVTETYNGVITLPCFTYSTGILNATALERNADNTFKLVNRIHKRLITSAFPSTAGSSYWNSFDFGETAAGSHGSGGNRNFGVGGHEIAVVYRNASNVFSIKIAYPLVVTDGAGGSIVEYQVPVNGAIDVSATPAIKAFLESAYFRPSDQSRYKVQFQFATNNTFSAGLVDYLQPDGKFEQKWIGNSNFISDVLPAVQALGGGVKYFRARLVNEFGTVGAWGPTQSFTVEHPPTLVGITPENVTLAYGTGDQQFTWEFNDPYPGDVQTAYQLQILTNALVVISDTGKILSSNKTVTANIAAGYKTQGLAWRVKGWDSMDDAGAFSDAKYFDVYDAPTVVIDSPASGATVTTGVPTILFTPTVNAGRVFVEYQVYVFQAGQTVWTSGKKTGSFASGVQRSVKVDPGILQDGQNYTIQVRVVDSRVLTAVSNPQPFTVDWVPPAAAAGVGCDPSDYDNESEGYVYVYWDDSARETDYFVRWDIYRRDRHYDPDTGTGLVTGPWKRIQSIYNVANGYGFADYFAPANYEVQYYVRQVVNRDGNEIDSANTAAQGTCRTATDGYWLIAPEITGLNASVFKLKNVTGDSYNDEIEEASFNVIGKGRVFQKGEDLGPIGSLTAQLRNNSVTGGGMTARMKKLRLEELQRTISTIWLRTPFGDVWPVNLSSMDISRVSGVGIQEFVDITIPYAKVGE